MCGGVYKRSTGANPNRSIDMRVYDQSLVNQYLDTSMALIGANASALFAAAAASNGTSTNGCAAQTVGFIHPLLYQKRLSMTVDDSTAQLLIIPTAGARTSVSNIEMAKLTSNPSANPNPNPNQVYDDISEAFGDKSMNCSRAALIASKVNEYCYIPASGLVAATTTRPIQIVINLIEF